MYNQELIGSIQFYTRKSSIARKTLKLKCICFFQIYLYLEIKRFIGHNY